MIGNEEDFTACLGFEIEGNDENLKELNIEGYKKMIDEASKVYPNFKVVATTLRTVKTATVNDWSALCWADGQIFKAKDYKGLEILDRVGGGDSFASGLVYGLLALNSVKFNLVKMMHEKGFIRISLVGQIQVVLRNICKRLQKV